jgi:hypothetical protein
MAARGWVVSLLAILFLIFVLNYFVGATVLSLVDKDGRLFKWYCDAPNGFLQILVLELWPVVQFAYWRLTSNSGKVKA